MTTQVSAVTLRVRELNEECKLIGTEMIQPFLSADGSLNVEEHKESLIKLMETSLAISRDAKAWSEGEKTYETWKEMFIRTNTNPDFMALDTTGRLKPIADEMIAFGDLREFYETDIAVLDMSDIDLAIDAQVWLVDHLKSL